MRRIMNVVGMMVVMLALVSCTSSYTPSQTGGSERAGATLDKSKRVLVTTPKDGKFEEKTYTGSGGTTAQSVDAAFSNYAASVDVYAGEYRSVKGLNGAAKGYGYIVVPTITHWEHRATAWSGRPSKASVRLDVLNASSGKMIASRMVDGESARMTFLPTSPEELLPGLINASVAQFYGETVSPAK